MLDRAAREALAKEILALSRADETEVILSGEDFGLTRFTHNAIHQNITRKNLTVRIRAIVDGRTGVAVTNELHAGALDAAVARASEMARLTPRGGDAPGLHASPRVTTPSGALFAATVEATPERRAHLAGQVFSVSQAEALWAAGYVATSHNTTTVANSAGTLNSFESSDASINVKQNAPDSTGFAQSFSHDVDAIDATRVASIAGAKAQSSRHPVDASPGPWTVILEPPAFSELLNYLADHFSAQAFSEGRSFLTDGLGKSYFGTNLTITDDCANPLAVGMPFDFEGTPRQRVTLIEAGVARNVVTDTYWAHKLDLPNTGHALPAPNSSGPQALNIVVQPGSKNTAELISQTERGLLVSRFWYIRTVDQRQAILTGMTRDGTFLIEDGQITRGVTNMRFNQSLLEALRNAEFSSEPVRCSGPDFDMAVPAAKITGFRFSSGTEF